MTKAQLEAMYPGRLALDNGDGRNNHYFVEPQAAIPNSTVARDRLSLWLNDGRLATFGLVSTNEPVLVASAPTIPAASAVPAGLPPPPSRSTPPRGKYAVQIAARAARRKRAPSSTRCAPGIPRCSGANGPPSPAFRCPTASSIAWWSGRSAARSRRGNCATACGRKAPSASSAGRERLARFALRLAARVRSSRAFFPRFQRTQLACRRARRRRQREHWQFERPMTFFR